MAIKIDFLANVRDFLRGTKDTEKALDDVADSLDDVVKDGDKSERELERNFKQIADAAKDADKAVDGISGTTKVSMKEAGQTTGEFKDEAKQNFGEVASSFSGDMSSAADLVQGTLGGLASSISGPLGLALGAASIALGAVIAQAQKDAEKAEELRVVAVEAVQAAFDEGIDVTKFSTSIDQVITKVQDLETTKEGNEHGWFWEDDPSRLEEWTDALKDVDKPSQDIVRTLEATAPALRATEKLYKKNKDAIKEQLDEAQRSRNIFSDADTQHIDDLKRQSDAYDVLIKNIDETATQRENETAAQQRSSDVGIDALKRQMEAEEAATTAAEDAAQRRQDLAKSVEDSTVAMYDSVRDAAIDAATSDDGVFDLQKWLDLVAESKVQADAYKANIASMQLTPEQWENFLALPEDTRATIASSYVVADDTTKASITTALTDSGLAGGAGAAVAFDESFNPTGDVEVTATADTKAAVTALENVAKATYEASITARADQSLNTVKTALDNVTRSRTVAVSAVADTGQAQRDIDSFITRNNGRKIYLKAEIAKGVEWQ